MVPRRRDGDITPADGRLRKLVKGGERLFGRNRFEQDARLTGHPAAAEIDPDGAVSNDHLARS